MKRLEYKCLNMFLNNSVKKQAYKTTINEELK